MRAPGGHANAAPGWCAQLTPALPHAAQASQAQGRAPRRASSSSCARSAPCSAHSCHARRHARHVVCS